MTAEEEKIFNGIGPLAAKLRVVLFETGGELDNLFADDPREALLEKINRASCLCQIAADLADALASHANALERASMNAPA